MDGPLTNIENLDLEELEVYGSEDMTQTQMKQYTFEVFYGLGGLVVLYFFLVIGSIHRMLSQGFS